MNVDIHLGWWLLPVIVSIVSYLWMDHSTRDQGGGIAGAAGAAIGCFIWFFFNSIMWIVYLLLVIFLKIA